MTDQTYPKPLQQGENSYHLRLMDADDRDAIFAITQRLSEEDLWFMRRDLTQPEAVDRWVQDIEDNRAITALVEQNGTIVGYGTLYHNQLNWNRHIAEARIMITPEYRNQGLGGSVAQELILIAKQLGFEKIFSYASAEDKGARRMLESVGFMPEALLADWIKAEDGRTIDLVIMSMSLVLFQS